MQRTTEELVAAIKVFLKERFFTELPELADMVSVAVTGSVAIGHYDEHSDIDLSFYFDTKANLDAHADRIVDFKKRHPSAEAAGMPIQIHRPESVEGLRETLSDWRHDVVMRETVQGLVVYDPRGDLERLRIDYRWHPEDVYREKVSWLFAELIFELKERFGVAAARGSDYYWEVSRLRVLRLAASAILLADHRFPANDKHLHYEIEKAASREFVEVFDRTLGAADIAESVNLAGKLADLVESELIDKGFITKQPDKYWIDLRPKYVVEEG